MLNVSNGAHKCFYYVDKRRANTLSRSKAVFAKMKRHREPKKFVIADKYKLHTEIIDVDHFLLKFVYINDMLYETRFCPMGWIGGILVELHEQPGFLGITLREKPSIRDFDHVKKAIEEGDVEELIENIADYNG